VAATKWRVNRIQTVGGGALTLSEVHLYDASGRIDTTGTLTSSVPPATGTLGDLVDNNLGTTASWTAAAVRAPGFFLQWEFASAAEVIGVRLGSAAAQSEYVEHMTLEFHNGSDWTFHSMLGRFPSIGNNSFSALPEAGDPHYNSVAILLLGAGADGGSTFVDSGPAARTVTATGAVTTSTAVTLFGDPTIRFLGGHLSTPGGEMFDPGAGAFTAEGFAYPIDLIFNDHRVLFGYANGSSATSNYAYQFLIYGSTWQLVVYSGSTAYGSATGTLAAGQWFHWAVSRQVESGTDVLRAFVNGVLIQTTNMGGVALNPATGGAFHVGRVQGSYPFNGYQAQIRFTKGVARYTSAFTPPTQKFHTQLSGTSFLPLLRRPVAAAPLITFASAPVNGAITARTLPIFGKFRDVENAGNGRIAGTVMIDGDPNDFPVRRLVRLHRDIDGLKVAETYSDETTGAYEFRGLSADYRYSTITYDSTNFYRAVIADNLAPEVTT
jgi:hypothetical protein